MRQTENWTVWAKKADFQEIGKKYGIDQVTARIMRNRDIITDEEINSYLNGTMDMLPSPYLLKDVKKAAGILAEKIKSGKKICIIGDYDIDGVQSSYILWEGIENLGGNVYVTIPDRIKDGYGVNEQLVEAAIEEGADTILTCDNGIAAADALKRAKENGELKQGAFYPVEWDDMMLLIQDPDAYYFKICLKNKQIRSLEKKVASLENSTTMKVGRAIMFIPLKIKKLFKKK